MKKQVFAFTLALLMIATLTGCGQGATPPASSAAPSAAPSTAPTAAPSAAPAPVQSEAPAKSDTPTIDRIKAAGKLVMLTNAAFPPFEYMGDDGKPAGVDVEIAQAIAAEIGVPLEVVDMDFDAIVMAVQSGKGDLGVAGMTNTEERRKNVEFSINYLNTTQMIIVPKDSKIKSKADLVGKTIGVQMGTTGDIFASDNIENAKISGFKTGPDAGIALANGQIEAIVIDEMPASQIVAANEGLKVLDEPLTQEQYAIAIAKENTDLKAVVDKVLDRLLKDGTVDKLIEKHMEVTKAE